LGGDINVKNYKRRTSFHLAVGKAQAEIIKQLIQMLLPKVLDLSGKYIN
jgi:hypothetical protein